MRRLVNELIDEFEAAGECEFSEQFAIPLPCTVFLALLGLPIEDLDLFLRFKNAIIRPERWPTEHECKADPARDRPGDLRVLPEGRRRAPRASPATTSSAASSPPRSTAHRLSDNDILDICYLFLLAGLDTVTASLTCAVAYLAAHPDRRDAIAADLSLVPAAVEELLRWETIVPAVPRVAMADIEIERRDRFARAKP